MSAAGYSLGAISDIPLAGVIDNVVKNLTGQQLKRPSRVLIFLTREGVDVLVSITVGGTQVYASGPCNISTVIGSMPSTENDLVVDCLAQGGDEIIIAGTNANAAAQELRALVQVMPIG